MTPVTAKGDSGATDVPKSVANKFLDRITEKIVRTLLENPTIPYNKSTLAEAADISRDALHDRWDMLTNLNIVEKADVEAKRTYWKLNPDAEIVNTIAKVLYPE